ncbi:MAG: NADH-quinone oxidoreductase subunit NuoE [Desulfobacteraceae bacterium]|jgi:NADH-quinone oxidoreductase subunit E|nr:MAG: NADH-quinone oxidoreductase subunit NuoE [Desulfobacteraceae bacterium]
MEQRKLKAQVVNDIPQIEESLTEIRKKFEFSSDELIPMLQYVQSKVGYLPEMALLEIASLTKLPSAMVFGVATFYEQFRLKPVGKHIIRVCRGTACHVRGSGRILNDIQKRFKLTSGDTSDDRLFTLETVACFGSCALAPVVVMDDSVNGRMNPSKTRGILEEIQKEADESSTVKSHTIE